MPAGGLVGDGHPRRRRLGFGVRQEGGRERLPASGDPAGRPTATLTRQASPCSERSRLQSSSTHSPVATTRTRRPRTRSGVCRPDGSVVHYRGTIEFWDTSGGTRVVNSVLVEQYLRGVLPREVPASWGSRTERDAGAQGPGRRCPVVRCLAEPQLSRRDLRRADVCDRRATRRRARSTAAPPGGRAARRPTSPCWRTRSPTRRSRRPPVRFG